MQHVTKIEEVDGGGFTWVCTCGKRSAVTYVKRPTAAHHARLHRMAASAGDQ